uniref:TDRD3 protein n=1 Tax=Fopius arisanus TaxID=64838 RepID=A0A0C9PW73_9HYME
MEKLQEQGWYLSEQGFNLVSDSGTVKDIQKLIKRALDMDLREIGSGTKDINLGNLVLQIQKLRNVSAPKSNEESRGAPRMLRLYLTDGKNNYQAVELDQLPSITLNTPPGTKILLKSGGAPTSHGIILLKPFNISSVLGGKVPALIEKWELNRKLAVHSRMRSADEGGPPPWIPFGKKIVKITEQDRNFKALADKDAAPKDNSEFEAQRQAAVAEAAKQGSKKVFGGGTKQLLDHSVQKIVDQGFSIEQAEHALKINRNNTDRALKSLQRNENRGNGNREGREPREPRGKRFEKKKMKRLNLAVERSHCLIFWKTNCLHSLRQLML